MNSSDSEQCREFWDRVAADWLIQVGDEGDSNRILNSDPVLWEFAGDVTGLRVLDAGCGTGYLTKKLQDRGASVTGIDFSERMIDIARSRYPDIDFRVGSCSELAGVNDHSFDMVISNYDLMEVAELFGTVRSFHRILKSKGVAVLVFSHPCFPQGGARVAETGDGIDYCWSFPYFQEKECIDAPWAHFTSEFIWFHRPLSTYWKAFKRAGFAVVDFEEPRVAEDRYHLAESAKKLKNSKNRPYSVAFKLQKLSPNC